MTKSYKEYLGRELAKKGRIPTEKEIRKVIRASAGDLVAFTRDKKKPVEVLQSKQK